MLVDSLKLGSGKELSEAEKMQRERQRIGDLKGIVSYEWTADSTAILVPLDGDLYLVTLDGKVVAQSPLVAISPIEEAGFFKRLWDAFWMWWESE